MKTLSLSLACFVLSCCREAVPPPPAPIEAGKECDQAGARLRVVCPTLATTKKGTAFAVVCKDAAQAGDPTILSQARCLALTSTCDTAKECR